MLNSLRSSAGGVAAKILLVLLILSFAAWGISDGFSGALGRQYLVAVGDRKITLAEYQRAYQAQVRNFSQRIGRPLTQQEAQALGLTQQTISRLIGGAVIDQHADDLGLGVSDSVIEQDILSEPAFQDSSGRFSRERFNLIIANQGYDENGYVANERVEAIRAQIVGVIAAPPHAPQALVEAVHRYQAETRVMKYFILPPAAAGDIPDPSDEQLKGYYDAAPQRFALPEYRKIRYLWTSKIALEAGAEIPEDEVKALYDQRKDRLGTPERRRLQRLAFPDLAQAQAAHERLKQPGADFLAIAKELGFSETDVDFGEAAKSDIADKKVAEAAFALKQGEISAPVDGALSAVILRVIEIKPGQTKSYDEAKGALQAEIAASKAAAKASETFNKVEDLRASGSTLADIAKEMGLEIREATFGRNGRAPGETAALDLPESEKLVAAAFAARKEVDNDAIAVTGGGAVWFELVEIMPSRQRPLEEARADVVKAWKDDETKTRLAQKAQSLIEQAKAEGGLEAAAKAVGAELKTTKPLKRADVEPGLPVSVVTQAFALEAGVYGSATGPGGARIVFAVSEITPPPPFDEAQGAEARKELSQAIIQDYVTQYLTGLEQRYPPVTNQQALQALAGGGEQ